jgi:4'-phosphopantetheinyl transferase
MPILRYKTYKNGVHLALWQITESHDELQAMLPSEMLTDAELATIHHPQKQVEFFCSRLCIKYLADKLNLNYLGIKKDEHGKPYLVGCEWQMSLTHSVKYVAVVMHATKPLGIDLERKTEKLLRIKNKYLSESELEFANDNIEKLTILWSAKEALYKLYGKRKVIFKENLIVKPPNRTVEPPHWGNSFSGAFKGRIKINEIDNEYDLLLEDLEEYLLVIAI